MFYMLCKEEGKGKVKFYSHKKGSCVYETEIILMM